MQQKVSDLTQLWHETGQGDAYTNDKSRVTRREPPQTLARQDDNQPLHKSTASDPVIDIADLEALLTTI
jgi:hypothetical protein